MKKIILVLIAITAIATGCDKTEQTLKKIYGAYIIETYTVDGLDSLSLYCDSLGRNFRIYYSDQSECNVCAIDGMRSDGMGTALVWRWELINKDKSIRIITSYGQQGTGPFGDYKTPEWDILELGTKNITLKSNYNNKEYIIELLGF